MTVWYNTRVIPLNNIAAAMLSASRGVRQPRRRLSMSNHNISPTEEQFRVCTRCGETRPIFEFKLSQSTRNGKTRRPRRRVCRLCSNIRNAGRRRQLTRTRQPLPVTEKRCSGCRLTLPASGFTVARREPDGLQTYCKQCRREYQIANKDREVQRVVEWQRANMDKVRAKQERWFLKNPDGARQLSRASVERRRARKSAAGGTFTPEQWLALCAKYDNRCLACGHKVALTVDHVVPIVLGGNNDIENLQPLCQSCNSKKGRRTLDYRSLWEKVEDDN